MSILSGQVLLDSSGTKQEKHDWFGRAERDAVHIGRRMLKMELPGKRKAKEVVYGCGERGHAGGWLIEETEER